MTSAEIEDSPLTGADLYEYMRAERNESGLLIYMRSVSSITAGVPYLVKWERPTADTIPMPLVFHDVHITALVEDTIGAEKEIRFAGNIPIGIVEEKNANHLFIGAYNTLYWPEGDSRMRGFRAHFRIPTDGPAAAPKYTPARIVLQSNTPTDIEDVQGDKVQCTKVIRNGHIIIIRNGHRYDVTGKKL